MRVAFSRIDRNTNSRSPGDFEIRANISEFAVSRCSASSRSRVSRPTSVSRPAGGLRRTAAFGALPRFRAAVLRRCVLTGSPPALERRLIAYPGSGQRIVDSQSTTLEVTGLWPQTQVLKRPAHVAVGSRTTDWRCLRNVGLPLKSRRNAICSKTTFRAKGRHYSVQQTAAYSITSSARASNVGDTLMSIACAALALMISSNLVGC
jgi:hypothetical protein